MVLACALLMKAWVPTGYMPVLADGVLLLQPCSGHGVMPMPLAASGHAHAVSPEAGMAHGAMLHGDMLHGDMAVPMVTTGHSDAAGWSVDMPCAFAGLAAAALTGAAPLLLAAAIAFLFVLALRARRQPALSAVAYLIPPAQGPPQLS